MDKVEGSFSLNLWQVVREGDEKVVSVQITDRVDGGFVVSLRPGVE